MASISRPLADDALHFALAEEEARLTDSELLERSGRGARTLIKNGSLRVTLIALAPGGHIAPHHATGPITVHLLSGSVHFRAAGREWSLRPGDLLSLGAEVEHELGSETGATLLLTLAEGAAP